MDPLNNGHGGDKQFVHCREAVLLSECPLSEVLLYTVTSFPGHPSPPQKDWE